MSVFGQSLSSIIYRATTVLNGYLVQSLFQKCLNKAGGARPKRVLLTIQLLANCYFVYKIHTIHIHTFAYVHIYRQRIVDILSKLGPWIFKFNVLDFNAVEKKEGGERGRTRVSKSINGGGSIRIFFLSEYLFHVDIFKKAFLSKETFHLSSFSKLRRRHKAKRAITGLKDK